MLTIDLSALQKNWLTIAHRCDASVAGVVKANAYGLGAEQVASALSAVGCTTYFVATLDEALQMRRLLPSSSLIFLLGGLRNLDLALLVDARIVPVLCSMNDIALWRKFQLKLQIQPPVALKINTGMNRFGLDPVEVLSLCDDPLLLPEINPQFCISHLSSADQPQRPENDAQLQLFKSLLIPIKAQCSKIKASLANSSGIFLGSSWHFDLVRPGAALYGINPTPHLTNPMLQVISLTLPVVQLRHLDSEASIGYGGTARLPAGSKIAVVSGGYADGAHRTLGVSPIGIILGHKVRAVGRISMDSMIFDVSDVALPDDVLRQASVTVLGSELTPDQLAVNNSALGYETLTSLGARYPRRYLPGVK